MDLYPDYRGAINAMAAEVETATTTVEVEFYIAAWDDVTAEAVGPSTGGDGPAYSIQRLVMGEALDAIIQAGRRNREEGRIVMIQAVLERR